MGKRMIIVEGPDGAGKSTLVEQLIKKFPVVEGTRGVEDRDKLWEVTKSDTYRAISEAFTDGLAPRVWDRLFWSEFAYYSITPRDIQFNEQDIATIPQTFKAMKAPVIFCMPPFAQVEANVNKVHQMRGVKTHIEDIYTTYENMLRDERYIPAGLNLMRYDYSATDARDVRHQIFGRIEAYLEVRQVKA